jgi:hypothetical protein
MTEREMRSSHVVRAFQNRDLIAEIGREQLTMDFGAKGDAIKLPKRSDLDTRMITDTINM